MSLFGGGKNVGGGDRMFRFSFFIVFRFWFRGEDIFFCVRVWERSFLFRSFFY